MTWPQTTYGLSRDDAGSFLPEYKAKGIVEHDPFVSLDPEGVGELITMAVQRGRSTRPEMKMGICGEHGGDPASIEVCEKIGPGLRELLALQSSCCTTRSSSVCSEDKGWANKAELHKGNQASGAEFWPLVS